MDRKKKQFLNLSKQKNHWFNIFIKKIIVFFYFLYKILVDLDQLNYKNFNYNNILFNLIKNSP